MHPLRSIAAAALLCATGGVMAQTPSAPAPAGPDAPVEKKLCRRAPAPTGSIMQGRRTCHTAAEWATIDKASAAASGVNANGRYTQDPGMANVPTGN